MLLLPLWWRGTACLPACDIQTRRCGGRACTRVARLLVLALSPCTARSCRAPTPPRPAAARRHPQTMWMATCSAEDGQWSKGELQPYGPLPMFPSAQALNYGQAVFEGMKAQRSAKVGARQAAPRAAAAVVMAPGRPWQAARPLTLSLFLPPGPSPLSRALPAWPLPAVPPSVPSSLCPPFPAGPYRPVPARRQRGAHG